MRRTRLFVTVCAAAATISLAGVALPATASANIFPVGGGCDYTTATPQIQEGSTGTAVKQAQCLLDMWGADLSIDGDFGPATNSATLTFQRAHGLDVDGQIGPKTWAALNSI